MDMSTSVLLIFGVTRKGVKFRPSDWIERFCGVMAPYSSNYHSSANMVNSPKSMAYSDLVFPTTINSERIVVAFEHLSQVEPLAWEFVLNFVRENDLKTETTSQLEFSSKNSTLKELT